MKGPVARLSAIALALATLTGACRAGGEAVAPTTTATIAVTTTVAPTPTSPPTSVAPIATLAPTTTPPPETALPPTTSPAPCAAWTNDPDSDGFPNRMSSLVGADIRTGSHPCFERVVIELAGSGEFPGWLVNYEDDVFLGQSGETIDVLGTANLVIHLAAWMQTMDGDGYSGPRQIFPTNVTMVEELRLADNSEGYMVWALGLDRERPFLVSILDGPPRLVVDIATGANSR